jgi:CarD family transcriptional regulator
VRNLSLRNRDSGLSSGEKTMLMNARRVLVSELSFSLNTSEEAVEKKLDAVLA